MYTGCLTKGLWRNRLQPTLPEARTIPTQVNFRSFAAPGKGRSGVTRRVKRIVIGKALLFARSLSLIGPAENPPALHLRLRSGHLPGFSLRRRWQRRGRQILALHRIHQLAVFGPADRRTIVRSRRRALG